MVKCLVCERHVLYRVVGVFKTPKGCDDMVFALEEHSLFTGASLFSDAKWLLKSKTRFGVAYILDIKLPNMQKKTMLKTAKEIQKLINVEDMDEGFIEIYEISDVMDLIKLGREFKESASCGR